MLNSLRFVFLVICVALPSFNGSVAATPSESQQRLWDIEPPLWELAQTATISREIPPTDPQPEGTWNNGSAPNLSTLKLKVSLWGPPSQLTLSLGKTDVWDRRRYQEPVITLEQIKQQIEQGETPHNHYRNWRAYDSPCPKPVGQVIIRCPDLDGAPQAEAVTRCDDGTTRVKIRNGGASADIVYLPMMTRNMIAVKCEFEGLKTPVSVRLYRHQDTLGYGESITAYGGPDPRPYEGYDYSKDAGNGPIDPPTSGASEDCFWIHQEFPAEKTFPDGFNYVMAGRILGSKTAFEIIEGKTGLGTPPSFNPVQQKYWDEEGQWRHLMPTYQRIREARGSAATAILTPSADGHLRFTLFVSVVTRADSPEPPMTEVKRGLATAVDEGFEQLLAENTEWFDNLYQHREKGRIFKGDPEFAREEIPKLFRSCVGVHGGFCFPDPTVYEAAVSYQYMEQDWSPWHGLPCYNELYYTSVHVQNRSETLWYWYKLVEMWLPACKKNAREVFNLPGALIQHGYLPPIKADEYAHTHSTWEFCMEIPAQVLKVLWDRFDYCGDERFLFEVAYPAMRETAIFYSHYASLEEDGYYHVFPTVSAEHWGWTKNFERNRDSASALCMFKWLLNTTADASELLGRDADLRAKWREVAKKLAPYPTFETPEGPVFTDVRGVDPIGVEYNWFAGITPTLLADEI
ncbi:MAG: hypothetical protein ABIH23_35370, partial [bacterium]